MESVNASAGVAPGCSSTSSEYVLSAFAQALLDECVAQAASESSEFTQLIPIHAPPRILWSQPSDTKPDSAPLPPGGEAATSAPTVALQFLQSLEIAPPPRPCPGSSDLSLSSVASLRKRRRTELSEEEEEQETEASSEEDDEENKDRDSKYLRPRRSHSEIVKLTQSRRSSKGNDGDQEKKKEKRSAPSPPPSATHLDRIAADNDFYAPFLHHACQAKTLHTVKKFLSTEEIMCVQDWRRRVCDAAVEPTKANAWFGRPCFFYQFNSECSNGSDCLYRHDWAERAELPASKREHTKVVAGTDGRWDFLTHRVRQRSELFVSASSSSFPSISSLSSPAISSSSSTKTLSGRLVKATAESRERCARSSSPSSSLSRDGRQRSAPRKSPRATESASPSSPSRSPSPLRASRALPNRSPDRESSRSPHPANSSAPFHASSCYSTRIPVSRFRSRSPLGSSHDMPSNGGMNLPCKSACEQGGKLAARQPETRGETDSSVRAALQSSQRNPTDFLDELEEGEVRSSQASRDAPKKENDERRGGSEQGCWFSPSTSASPPHPRLRPLVRLHMRRPKSLRSRIDVASTALLSSPTPLANTPPSEVGRSSEQPQATTETHWGTAHESERKELLALAPWTRAASSPLHDKLLARLMKDDDVARLANQGHPFRFVKQTSGCGVLALPLLQFLRLPSRGEFLINELELVYQATLHLFDYRAFHRVSTLPLTDRTMVNSDGHYLVEAVLIGSVEAQNSARDRINEALGDDAASIKI